MTAVFNFLMIAGAVQGFIFNIATFLSRKKIERPVLFLNLFVLFLSLNNLQSWLIEKNFLSDGIVAYDFTVPWYVLIVPMFYAFLVHYLEIEEKKMPFITVSLMIFVFELIARSLVTYLGRVDILPMEYIEHYNTFEDILTLTYSLFLYYKAIQIVFKKTSVETPVLAFDDLQWLKWFFYLGGVVFVLWIMAIVFNATGMVPKPYSYYPLRLGSSILIYWVGYQAFFRYVVLKDRIVLRKEIRKGRSNDSSEKTLAADTGESTFKEVEAYVHDNQRFLDPYLGLEKLSEELGMSTGSLSKLMNAHSGSNFSDYINKYRVEEAKKLLGNPDFSAYTIVSIGLECGFNSKSTFYSAFKKFTGQTPTVYRKKTA